MGKRSATASSRMARDEALYEDVFSRSAAAREATRWLVELEALVDRDRIRRQLNWPVVRRACCECNHQGG